MGEDAVQTLANSPVLVPSLRALRLSENGLDSTAVTRLRHRFGDRVIF